MQLFCGAHLFEVLSKLNKDNTKNELRFILITSAVEILPESQRSTDACKAENMDLWIKVMPSKYAKCARCWHQVVDVGLNSEHPTLCGRCVGNLFGDGEMRNFA